MSSLALGLEPRREFPTAFQVQPRNHLSIQAN